MAPISPWGPPQRRRWVPNWFLASAGADLADLVGGMAVKDELTQRDHLLGMGGAAVGISIGVAGAVTAWRSRSS